jgi:hypothetical protein
MTNKDQPANHVGETLGGMSDEELGKLVRNTAAFRAAASCSKFADEANELRENDSLAFDRLVKETHAKQGTSVSKRATTETIINTFIDVVEEHAELAEEPADAAENAASEVVQDDG